jgi:hypothetical protein
LDIDVRTNGTHSMAKGLEAFKAFHEDQKDIFALKDSILRSHHALETLFKNILYEINPVLLVSDDSKVKDIIKGYENFAKGNASTVLDETKTTSLEDSIDRLKRLGLIKLDEREYAAFLDAVTELCSYRNRLQHLGISADPEVVGRILGTVIPRGIEVLNSIPTNPYHTQPSLVESLTSIYPESESVIDLLRNTYDAVIRETIDFFNKKEFSNQELLLKITDHGRVGAPPYFAELNLTGFINYSYDIRQMLDWRWRRTDKGLPYQANVSISEPIFTMEIFPDMGISKGNLTLDAQIILDLPDGSLILPEAEEKTRVLRGLTIVIKAVLDYEAEAMMNNWHYDVRRLKSATGLLSVKIAAIPRGYKKDENEIIGEYQEKLDEKNAPFRMHCFVEPSGMLSKNHTLDWNIIAKGNLKFK